MLSTRERRITKSALERRCCVCGFWLPLGLLPLRHARSGASRAGCHVHIAFKGKVRKQPLGGIVPRYLSSTVADWALENFVVSHSELLTSEHLSRLAIAITSPVTHAAKQANSRRSLRRKGHASASPIPSLVQGHVEGIRFRSSPESRSITKYFALTAPGRRSYRTRCHRPILVSAGVRQITGRSGRSRRSTDRPQQSLLG
jgi:hypothetical protein